MTDLTTGLALGEAAAALRSGAAEVVGEVEARCERLEATEAELRAFLPERGRRERLVREAEALLAQYPEPSSRPALFGVCVGVKDLYAVDGFETRCGSALPAELFDWPESSAVGRLRAAGALILGKTVTTEFAYRDAGATSNPHHTEHTPGGSSSGSAAAVGAGVAPLALGTETGGSIMRPAAFCGVIGVKPTYGRIPIDGVQAFAPSLDTVGFFTQDFDGAVLTASVLCDGWDASRDASGRAPVVGVIEGPYLDHVEPASLVSFERSLAAVEAAGCEVRRLRVLDDFEAIALLQSELQAAAFAETHEAMFRDYGALYGANSAEMMERGRKVSRERLAEGRAGRGALRQRLEGAMEEHGLDVWMSPGAPGPAPEGLHYTGDHVMNIPWSYSGLPAVMIPAGKIDGLPLGVEITARANADEALLSHARTIAAALPVRE